MLSLTRRLAGALLLGTLIVSTARPSRADEPLTVPVPTTGVELRFRFCPKGEVRPGRPKADGPKAEPVAAFYIGESEVTFTELVGVLGKERVKAMLDRLAPAGLDRLVPDLEKHLSGAANASEPVYLASIEDAVTFCKKVNDLLRANREEQKKNKNWVELIELRSVRLPTWTEWQYAARAVTAPEQAALTPHFPPGRNGKVLTFKDLGDNGQQRCIEAWQAASKTAPNTKDAWLALTAAQFQDRLLELDAAELGDKRAAFNDVLKEFFEKTYGWPYPARSGELLSLYGERDRRASSPNAWGVWGTLDNVTEWVLQGSGVWDTLAKGDFAALKSAPLVSLAGGTFTSGYTDRNGLAQRAVWGGPFAAPPAYDEKLMLDKQPGFRLVLERSVIDNWLYQTRQAWIVNGQYTRDAAAQLRAVRAKVESLFPDKAERDKQLALLVPYELQASPPRSEAEKAARLQKLVDDKLLDKNDKLLLELTDE